MAILNGNDVVTKFGVYQLVETPTRVTKRSSTIIDHIYTNSAGRVSEVFVSNLSISDHYPISCTRSTIDKICNKATTEHNTMQYRCFKRFKESKFQQDLAYSSLYNIEAIADPNEALSLFYEILESTLSKHAPVKTKRIKREQQHKWFTEEIQSLIHKRNTNHKNSNFDKYKKNKNKNIIKD